MDQVLLIKKTNKQDGGLAMGVCFKLLISSMSKFLFSVLNEDFIPGLVVEVSYWLFEAVKVMQWNNIGEFSLCYGSYFGLAGGLVYYIGSVLIVIFGNDILCQEDRKSVV